MRVLAVADRPWAGLLWIVSMTMLGVPREVVEGAVDGGYLPGGGGGRRCGRGFQDRSGRDTALVCARLDTPAD
jgi:hypothetical protein